MIDFRGGLPGRHVGEARLGHRTILDCFYEMFPPEFAAAGHRHIHARQSGGNAGMLGTPIGNDEALNKR